MEDIEIARKAKLKRINEITDSMHIPEEYVEMYGKYKAKVNLDYMQEIEDYRNGKLILVTSINPTPLGEGKTTISIGLADAMKKVGKNVVLALREPSLGPVFGIKGGATGGGYAQIAPMEDINLHFTGDLHAITCANNLLSAMIDNHIFHGNELQIDKITWKRCLDLNDRALRKITIGQSGEKKMIPREDGFDITAASETMAILCLSSDMEDLKCNLGNIIIGYNINGEPVYCKDLKAEGAMSVVLKDAMNPNVVQTLENTPAFVHGGPFANIAHGCNSLVATQMALKIGDYVVTEAGFGADLGAEKFLDIKRRCLHKNVDCVVVVATIKALKYHGGKPKDEVNQEDLEALRKGYNNLKHHIDVIRNVYKLPVVVAINKYEFDTEHEITSLKAMLDADDVEMSVAEEYEKGSEGTIDLAEKVIKVVDAEPNQKLAAEHNAESSLEDSNENKNDGKNKNHFEFGMDDFEEEKRYYSYDLEESIVDKFRAVAQKVYGAEDVEFSDEAMEEIKRITGLHRDYEKMPVCIAKTQYSLSDDDKNLYIEEPFKIHIRQVILKGGAEFIVGLTGKIMTMPGLPKTPAAENIDLDWDNNIVGIF